MRKRGLKRIPQDILPWARVTKIEDDTLNIYTKKQTRWESGNRRNFQTQLLNIQKLNSMPLALNNFNIKDARIVGSAEHYTFQSGLRVYNLNNFKGKFMAKNFCLFLGKGRTYNRKLFISRQTVRKLMKTGLLFGLQK